MSLSSSAILDRHLCNFPPKVYGRERFDLPHQQHDYILRPCESICWNSPCLISPAQRPIEGTTYVLFSYMALNEQPLLARLRPAGGTERIVVIAIDETIRSLQKHSVKFPHSPILHYAFSSWIEKTMTKTIYCFTIVWGCAEILPSIQPDSA